MKKIVILIFLMLIVSILPAKKLKFKTYAKDGITYANNQNLVIANQELKLISSISSDNEDQFPFGQISGMTTAKDNSVYILDGLNCEIFHYSASGNFIKKFGGKGKGPEEMLTPQSIICIDDKLIVADQGNSRIHTFDLDGNTITTTKINTSSLRQFVPVGNEYVTDSWIVQADSLFLLHSLDSNFEVKNHFGWINNNGFDFGSLIKSLSDICVSSNDEIYMNNWSSGVITKYKDSQKIMEITRPLMQKVGKSESKTEKDGDSVTMSAKIEPVTMHAAVDSKDNFYSVIFPRPNDNDDEIGEQLLQVIDNTGKVIGNYRLGDRNFSKFTIASDDSIWAIDLDNEEIYHFAPINN